VKYKNILLMLGLLMIIIVSLVLIKKQQDLRRGAAGLRTALLILSPESVGVSINDKFDVNISVSIEATMSAAKLNICYPTNVDLESQNTELADFNLYVNAVGESGGEKCVEVVLTGVTSDDKLPSKFFKLLHLGFVAKSEGRGAVRVEASKSQMVGIGGEIAFDSGINEVIVSVGEIPTLTPTPFMKYWKCDPVTMVCEEISPDECELIGEDCWADENCPIGYSCTKITVTPTPVMKYWICDEEIKICEEVSETVCNLDSNCKISVDCPEGYTCAGVTITLTPIPKACQDCKSINPKYLGNGRQGGDYNCDRVVNGTDFVIWRREALDKIMKGDCWQADGTGDNKVSLQDYSLWREWYLR
jgi:hypothetical protein